MNEALIVSQALLWVVVLALGVAVFALTRQVGILYERIAPAGALALNQSLKVGAQAPVMKVETLSGSKIDVAGGSARARLYFFLSPSCPVCKTLLPALRSVAKDERRSVDVILASDGELQAHRSFVQMHRLENFDYVLSELLGRAMGVSKLPYAVLVNPDATIASFGIVNSREHFESLIEGRERGVASIQDYMQAAHAASDNENVNASADKGVARAVS